MQLFAYFQDLSLEKKFFDMVHGFDQQQTLNTYFLTVFHNINQKVKPMNRDRHKIIFQSFFLSPSWRLWPLDFIVSLKTPAVFQDGFKRVKFQWLSSHSRREPLPVRRLSTNVRAYSKTSSAALSSCSKACTTSEITM